MSSYIKNLPFILILCIFTLAAEEKNIIFDLGGVLFDTNSRTALQSIGIKNLICCMISLKKGPHAINAHLKSKLFEILEHTAAIKNLPKQFPIAHDGDNACDETGVPLPYLMRAWLNGTLTSKEIRTHTLTTITESPSLFSSTAEKQAITNLVTMIFTPKHFAASRKIYPEGLAFVQECKKKGYKIFVLSNWDTESFALLRKKYHLLFDLFDGIVISSNSNSLKPSPTIYAHLLTEYNLNPQECWFIDDQPENIKAAQHAGIKGIVCRHAWPFKKPHFNSIARSMRIS